jgi:hypothetical protein
MLERREDHVCAGNLGLVFFLVQRPIQVLRHLRNLPREVRVAVFLDIASAAFIIHADGAKHNDKWDEGDLFLSVCELGDLFDDHPVGDHAEHPGQFIPAGWGKARRLEQFLSSS